MPKNIHQLTISAGANSQPQTSPAAVIDTQQTGETRPNGNSDTNNVNSKPENTTNSPGSGPDNKTVLQGFIFVLRIRTETESISANFDSFSRNKILK